MFSPNFRTMIPFYLDHVPSGSSTRPFVHYAQLHLLDREFRKFDFGSPEKNTEHYGVSIPPKHDLSKVKVSNFSIFYLCLSIRIAINFYKNQLKFVGSNSLVFGR